MKYKFTLILSALFGALLVPSAAARAITVSPVIFEADIAKGASRQDTIKIWNDSGVTQTFILSVRNFVPSGEEGAQSFLEEDRVSDLASWVTLDKPMVTLQPGEAADFPFVISVPVNAEPGGHYAAVFFASAPGREASGMGIGAKTGVLLLVNVPGEVRQEARVESFRLLGGRVLTRLPADFELRIRNLGNTHFRPRGTLVMRNILGSVVDRVAANPKNSAVLPQSVRRIYSVWAKTFDVPQGGFWTETINEWRNFALGRYKAEMDVTYGTQNAKLEVAPVVFWVLPWHLLLLALLVLVLLVLLVRLYNMLIVRAVLKRATALSARQQAVSRRGRTISKTKKSRSSVRQADVRKPAAVETVPDEAREGGEDEMEIKARDSSEPGDADQEDEE